MRRIACRPSPTDRISGDDGLIRRQDAAAEIRIAEQDILGLRSGLQQSAKAIRILDGFDRLIPLWQRHVGLRDVVLADDSANEHRLPPVHEGEEVVFQTAAGRIERIASLLFFLPHHGGAGHESQGLKLTARRLPLASVTIRGCRTR